MLSVFPHALKCWRSLELGHYNLRMIPGLLWIFMVLWNFLLISQKLIKTWGLLLIWVRTLMWRYPLEILKNYCHKGSDLRRNHALIWVERRRLLLQKPVFQNLVLLVLAQVVMLVDVNGLNNFWCCISVSFTWCYLFVCKCLEKAENKKGAEVKFCTRQNLFFFWVNRIWIRA